MNNLGIIGGSGIYNLEILDNITEETMNTPYGSTNYVKGYYSGKKIIFMTRHGKKHSISPHKINYRANIWALKHLGVHKIYATTAVGSLNKNYQVGDFVVCDQILDFTKNRISTFFDQPNLPVVHTSFTYPYCPVLRNNAIKKLEKLSISFHKTGTYVVTEGPRYESKAEIIMYNKFGGDIVGMTNMPEAILAREAEMCYSNISIITNMGAGLNSEELSHKDVVEKMELSTEKMKNLLVLLIKTEIESEETCNCEQAIKNFGGFTL